MSQYIETVGNQFGIAGIVQFGPALPGHHLCEEWSVYPYWRGGYMTCHNYGTDNGGHPLPLWLVLA